MIGTQVNAQSMRLLQAAMLAAERKTTRTAQENVKKAMHYVCRSGGAAVKPRSMKTRREIVAGTRGTNALDLIRKGIGTKYSIKVLRQDAGANYLPTDDKNDPRRIIRNLGLARELFWIAAGKFGKTVSKGNIRGARKRVKATLTRTKDGARALAILAVSYIEKAFPAVMDTAIHKGMASFVREFDRDWATAMKEGRY